MAVKKICARDVDVISPEEPVRLAAMRMHDRKVGSLVVCNDQRKPVGILTDRDLAMRVVAAGNDPNEVIVSEVMTWDPRCIDQDAPIEDAISFMRVASCRRLPVVDSQQHVIGMVTLDDILGLVSQEFQEIGTLLWSETPDSLAVS